MDKVIVPIAVFFLKVIGLLPLRVNQALGAFIGWFIWVTKGRAAKVTVCNIEACFPHLSRKEQQQLAYQSMLETGRTMTEIAFVWFRNPKDVLGKVVQVDGEALIENTQAAGKGVLLLGPHHGNWEVTGLYLASKYQMASMYKPPKSKEYEKVISKARGQTGAELVPTNPRGVARLLTILKKGGVIGVLPDQVPPDNSGEFAPFFGRDAFTMVLISRMVQKVDVDVYTACAIRLPKGKGFRIEIKPAEQNLFNSELSVSLAGLNKSVENAVMGAPAQYQWEYKRFRRIAPGQENIYINCMTQSS